MAKSQSQPDLLEALKKLGEREEAKYLIPTGFLAIAAIDAVPAPTDIGFFYTDKYLEDHKTEVRHYYGLKALNYYGWDIMWHLALFGITYKFGKNAAEKILIGGSVLSAGAIAALLWKFSQKNHPAEAPVEEMTGLAGLELIA
jgi:hypothetical protein